MRIEDEVKQTREFKNEHQKAIVNLLYTHSWVNMKQSQFLKKFGISTEQFNVLRILRGQYPEPATVNLIQDRMLNRMSNASRLVEKLRKKNLVERKECSQDRRRVDVLITPEGLEKLDAIDEAMPEMEKIYYNIDEQEARTLNNILDKLRG